MEKVIIINISKELIGNYSLEHNKFYNYKVSNPLIKENTLDIPNFGDLEYELTKIIEISNIIFSDYEFISPMLEEKSKDYNFIELCIKENEFKLYNFDYDLFNDIDDFNVYDNNTFSNKYYILIYRFLSYALLDNKPINIKSALSYE